MNTNLSSKMQNKKILVTGGAGFIGSNFVHYVLENRPEYEIVVLDKLTYAGRLENLQDVMKQITFIKGDICNRKDTEKAIKGCDMLFNYSAETHVDRSIEQSGVFVKTDIIGTHTLLEAAKDHKIEKYIQISSDEVFGSTEKGSFKETDRLDPSSPYSASKAGADMLVNAYHKTFGLPTLITRSSNNYGAYQFPEKIIPLFITNLLQKKKVPIYGDGMNVRDWLYVLDNCEGILTVAEKGKIGEIYNIGGNYELTNIELTMKILALLGLDETYIKHVPDRLGHDQRYSLNSDKIMKLGWKPKVSFEAGLDETVQWYKKNKWWWECLKHQ